MNVRRDELGMNQDIELVAQLSHAGFPVQDGDIVAEIVRPDGVMHRVGFSSVKPGGLTSGDYDASYSQTDIVVIYQITIRASGNNGEHAYQRERVVQCRVRVPGGANGNEQGNDVKFGKE